MKTKTPAMQEELTFPVSIRKGDTVVKIYRTLSKAGYESFQVADYSSGRRKFLTFSDYDAARKKAGEIGERKTRGDVDVLKLTSSDRASYLRSLELLKPTAASLETVAATFADAFALLGGNRIAEAARFFLKHNPANRPQRTVKEVVVELLDAKERANAGPRYMQDLRYRLDQKFAVDFGCNISDVTAAQVQTWLDGLKLAPRSYINFKRVVGTLFRFAIRRGYLPKDHDIIDQLERIKAPGADIEVYSPAEMVKLLAAAPKEFLPALIIGGFCGLRSAEIEKLSWSEVKLAKGFIEVTAGKAKTKTRRLAPIPANAVAWLTPFAKTSGKVWTGTHDALYDSQQATAAAAGIPWKANGLRHSFISYRVAQGDDMNKTAMECGNSPGVIHGHYRALVEKADAETWFAIAPTTATNVISLSATA